MQLPGGFGCQEENQPGDPDQTCTDAFNQALDAGAADGGIDGGGDGGPGFQLEGCCRPDGKCGVLVDAMGLNLGCVDVSGIADGGLTVPTCTP